LFGGASSVSCLGMCNAKGYQKLIDGHGGADMGFWLGRDMNTQYPILQCDNHTMYIPQTFSFSSWIPTSKASLIPFPVIALFVVRRRLSGCCRRTGPVARAPGAPVTDWLTCIPSRQPQNDLGIGCLRAWASPFPEASELRGGQCGAPRPKRPLRLPRRITSSAWSRLSLRHCPQTAPDHKPGQTSGNSWV
jgi:hypothetical protein